MTFLRQEFLLDPEIVFLNHGSFGACPRAVFEEYQRRQLELERQPVEFLARDRRFPGVIEDAKARLSEYVGVDSANLIFVPNATSGINMTARSLRLVPGNEVLTSDHEYGALDLLWKHVCERSGAHYVRRPPESLPEVAV